MVRSIAAAAFARAGRRAALPLLLARLDDPVAYVRMRLFFAVEELLGRPLSRAEYDPRAGPATRAEQAARLRRLLHGPHQTTPPKVIGSSGPS
jgi:hypothetical protein